MHFFHKLVLLTTFLVNFVKTFSTDFKSEWNSAFLPQVISQVADHLFNTKKISKQVSMKKACCLLSSQGYYLSCPNVTEHILWWGLANFFLFVQECQLFKMSVIEREIHKGILEDKVRKYSGMQCFYDIPSHWKM
jgi:hypothetical protein